MNRCLYGLLCCFFLRAYAAADNTPMDLSFEGISVPALHRKLVDAVTNSDKRMISKIFKLKQQDNESNVFDFGYKPILFYCKTREIAELLVSFGVNVSARDRDRHFTIVHHTVCADYDENSCDLLRYYLEQGVSANAYCRSWGEPLGVLAVLRIYRASHEHLAVAKQMVEILLENGAHPQSKYPQGWAKGKTAADVIRMRATEELSEMSERGASFSLSNSMDDIEQYSDEIKKSAERCQMLSDLADYIEQYKQP